MKLPQDKNERNKVLGLVGLGVAIVCYAGYTFGAKPFLQKRQDFFNNISELEDKLWKADKDIKMIPSYFEQNNEIISRIIDISENKLQILHPNLGNYLLVAGDIINRHADNFNLTVTSIKEVASPERFSKNDDDTEDPKAARFKPYTVNVSLKCSFYELEKLVGAIEEENPYLCITRIGVIGQPEDVMKHSVSFDVQWPIWADEKHPIKLIAQQMIAKSRE